MAMKRAGPENGSLLIGYILHDHYRIVGILRARPYSNTYQARNLDYPNTQPILVIKEIHGSRPDTAADQRLTDRVNTFKALSHPGLVPVIGNFVEKHTAYVVMRYANGKDLEAIIKAVPVPTDLVVRWAIQLCDVLMYLHNQSPHPIFFRNLKPSNIMLNQRGEVQLVDYSFARDWWGESLWCQREASPYSAPENLEGFPSPAADIFSLGATLYYALVRQPPSLDAIRRVKHPVKKLNPDIPTALETIVLRMLQPDPQDRYPNTLTIKHELESLRSVLSDPSRG